MKGQQKQTYRRFSLTEENPEARIAIRKSIQRYYRAVRDDRASGKTRRREELPPEHRLRILD